VNIWHSYGIKWIVTCTFFDLAVWCGFAVQINFTVVQQLPRKLYWLLTDWLTFWYFDWQRVARSVCGSRASCITCVSWSSELKSILPLRIGSVVSWTRTRSLARVSDETRLLSAAYWLLRLSTVMTKMMTTSGRMRVDAASGDGTFRDDRRTTWSTSHSTCHRSVQNTDGKRPNAT